MFWNTLIRWSRKKWDLNNLTNVFQCPVGISTLVFMRMGDFQWDGGHTLVWSTVFLLLKWFEIAITINFPLLPSGISETQRSCNCLAAWWRGRCELLWLELPFSCAQITPKQDILTVSSAREVRTLPTPHQTVDNFGVTGSKERWRSAPFQFLTHLFCFPRIFRQLRAMMKTGGNKVDYGKFENILLVGRDGKNNVNTKQYLLTLIYLMNHSHCACYVCFETRFQGCKFAQA